MISRYIILALCITLTSCTSPYHEHFWRENIRVVSGETRIGSGLIGDGVLVSLPNTNTKNDLISSIDRAELRIWVEIYTWTDAAKLTDSIIRAKNRGVDVRIVLEGNVFGTPRINIPVVKKLKEANIPVVYADNDRYSFTHAKFWIIDDTYSISTGNWTASFFNKNREYIYTDDDPITLRFLEEIFASDQGHMSYKDISQIPPHIIISPLNTRSRFEELILSTGESIILYVQTLDDDQLITLISGLIQSGKKVEICTADNESNQARKTEFPTWKWTLIRKPYIHTKAIIIDRKRVFIGSHNLTTNAIENNREIGIILDQRSDIVAQIESDFVGDGCR